MCNVDEMLNFVADSPEIFILDHMINLYDKKPKNTNDDQIDYISWLNVFNTLDGKKRILQIMSKLYPKGMNLDVDKINKIFQESLKFVKYDKEANAICCRCRKFFNLSL